mgnify:CR=1 FL=1
MNSKRIMACAISLLMAAIVYAGYDIHPTPQQMDETGETVSITGTVNVVCEADIAQTSIDRLIEVLTGHGLDYVLADRMSGTLPNVIVGSNGSGGVADSYASRLGLTGDAFVAADNKFDAHCIAVTNADGLNGVAIIGDGNGSEYYAMATLDQILGQSPDGAAGGVTIRDFAHTEHRGIVEGFYGIPYSHETIAELLAFCKRYKMNTFIYGPKSDPYHLGQWREDYPTRLTEEQERNGVLCQNDFRELTAIAKACNVDFVWAIHPGMQNGISFTDESSIDQGVADIMDKFKHMHDLGVRAFGIFIDDMSYTPSGAMQARLADRAQEQLRSTFGDGGDDGVAPLFFVPTAYALNYSSSYTLTSLATVDPDVVIAFTGYDCFSNIRGSSIDDMAGRVARHPVMWWNNPVNDDHDDRLYMRSLTTHWTIEDTAPIGSLAGLVLNPMVQGNASKVALFGAAEYAWHPAAFDADKSWEDFFKAEYTDKEMREALMTFAANSDAIVEEQTLTDLYEQFRREYSPGKLPGCADKLMDEAERIRKACTKLADMETSDDPRYSLMYADIKPWVAKLGCMAGIIADAITYMKGEDESAWTLAPRITEAAARLHTDPDHAVTVFEGSGNDVTQRLQEVSPSQQQMEPFAEYIAGLIDDFAYNLPERRQEPEIITNLDTVPARISINVATGRIALKGLSSLKLGSNEYIGINLNSIKAASFVTWPEDDTPSLQLQHSMSGKQWTEASHGDTTRQEMAYFRLRNTDPHDSTTVATDSIVITFEEAHGTAAATASTNMEAYEDYTVDNVTDGDTGTFFWSDRKQQEGDCITLDLGTTATCHEITVKFNDGDKPSGIASIETSTDSLSWDEVAAFTRGELDDDNRYTCDAGGRQARYIRLIIRTSGSEEWLQVADFSVMSATDIAQAVNDQGEPVPCLSDRRLDDSYSPDEAGRVIYRFIENISIDTITIYQYTDFTDAASAPIVELLADGQNIDLGPLTGTVMHYDVAGTDSISAIRISWEDDCLPSLVEVYPVGKPYVELPGEPDEPVVGLTPPTSVPVCRHANTINIGDSGQIAGIKVWTVDGICIAEATRPSAVLTLDEAYSNTVVIVALTFDDGKVITQKL